MHSRTFNPFIFLMMFLFSRVLFAQSDISIYAQGFLVTYPKEPNAAVSENYTVYVNETPINVHKVATNNDVSYAHFSFAGKITVRVHMNVLVKTYNLSPHGYGTSPMGYRAISAR